jgi:hypothetical protein
VCAISLIATAGACTSSSGEGQDSSAPTRPSTPSRQAFDPPRTFDTTASTPLPDAAWDAKITLGGDRIAPLPILLDGTRGYVAAVDRLELVDLDQGTVTETLRPTYEPALSSDQLGAFAGGNPATPPVPVAAAGHRWIVTAFATTAPGQGTTPSRPIVELVAVDAKTGASAGRAELDAGQVDSYSRREHPVVLGADAATVIVRIGDDTVAVDLNTSRETWRRPDFAAGAVAGSTVVGADIKTLSDPDTKAVTVRGLAAASGQERWSDGPYRSATVAAGNPKVLTATGTGNDGKHFFQLVDAASGKVLDKSIASGRLPYQVECIHDAAAVTVCQTEQPDRWVGAFDDSGAWLWELPDAKNNRIAPTVTAAWHGAVYGHTGNGPLVLDARTGQDRESHPGIAPWLVNELFAVASPPEERTDGVSLYRTVS